MSELATNTTTDTVQVSPPSHSIRVVATKPEQLGRAHGDMIAWGKAKVQRCRDELAEIDANIETAMAAGWSFSGLKSAQRRAKGSLNYYEKILAALQAGYCIVPNFPVDVFAIRTDRVNPSGRPRDASGWERVADVLFRQPSRRLALGEGRYVSDVAHAEQVDEYETDSGTTVRVVAPAELEEPEFPIAIVQPEVVEATAQAMSELIFDEMGVLPGRRPKGDPIVVGRIRHPHIGAQWDFQGVTFMVAWWLDTESL